MDEREIKLAVKNLKIGFKTDGGKVQAVRDISFDLYKGETLAIVGESGSGKSVTNRAIMGILAGNAIKDGGEIIYDGQDLMKIPEEQFHKLRGDKISMIFQDPMSSLNPIMRVGKQMTEAMLIKGKINQRESRKDFNTLLSRLNKAMDEARGADNREICEENKLKCKNFNKFEYKHLELENAYNKAHDACTETVEEIKDVLFRIEKNAFKDVRGDIREIAKVGAQAVGEYVVKERAEELKSLLEELKQAVKEPIPLKIKAFIRKFLNRGEAAQTAGAEDWQAISEKLKRVQEILSDAEKLTMPNFFAMGYYLTFSEEPLPEMDVPELNKFLRKYLDDKFMLDFIALAKEGVLYSNAKSIENKKSALSVIDEQLGVFRQENLDKKSVTEAGKTVVEAVENAIDKLEIIKDNVLYTFRSSLKAAVNLYFDGIKRNAAEEKRFAKQTAKAERKAKSGKTLNYKIADKNLVDLDLAKEEIVDCIMRVYDDITSHIERNSSIDFDARVVDIIDYLKAKASGVVHKVTRRMAKTQALKLLDEVGIPEARKRYRQYPFEFSGGMRQRIVIAIALSANPDILICDEPTTALDVTIQSQILELINKVKVERQLSVIFITHDLGVVANMADRVAVMYAGKIVEIGTADDVFYAPAHPYTWALLSSMPDLETKEKLEAIPGTPPNMIFPPKGDAFAARNKYALEIDFEQQPPLFKISDTHFAATWLLHPDAPKVDPPKAVTDRISRMKKKSLSEKNGGGEKKSAVADGAKESGESAEPEKKSAKKTGTVKKTAVKEENAKTEKPSAKKPSAGTAKAAGKKAAAGAAKTTAKKTVKKGADDGKAE